MQGSPQESSWNELWMWTSTGIFAEQVVDVDVHNLARCAATALPLLSQLNRATAQQVRQHAAAAERLEEEGRTPWLMRVCV